MPNDADWTHNNTMPYGTQELKIIGYAKPQSFEITSGKMIVTDPCYDKETWCQAKLDNVKTGKWHATAEYSDEGDWGDRVASIWVWHDSLGITDPGRDFPNCNESIPADIGVDSGQAGFFDLEQYPDDPHKDNAFYDAVCKLTLSGIPFSALEEAGVYPMADLDKLTDDQKALRASSDYDDRNDYYRQRFISRDGDDTSSNQRNRSKMADALELHGSLGSFGVMPFGAVSSSGFGDGGYNLDVYRENGEIVAATITFIVEDDGEDDDDND
jgi:hypothetical protein